MVLVVLEYLSVGIVPDGGGDVGNKGGVSVNDDGGVYSGEKSGCDNGIW